MLDNNREKMFYFLVSTVFAVKGYARTILYDLQRHNSYFFPNDVTAVLEAIKSNSIIELDIHYQNDIDIFNDYIKALSDKELIVKIQQRDLDQFSTMPLHWFHFSNISNTVIDFNFPTPLVSIFEQLVTLNSKAICIRYMDEYSFAKSAESFKILEDSIINCIDFDLFFSAKSIKLIDELNLEIIKRIRLIRFYNPLFVLTDIDLNQTKLTNTFLKVFEEKTPNKILQNDMIIAIPLFTESQLHNTYFNRKLAIDENGFIKNSPELPWHYGNVADIEIAEAIKDEGTDPDFFKKYALYLQAQSEGEEYVLDFEISKPAFNALYFIHKEMIDVCKECEFRHMCVDACTPVQRADDSWYRSVECNYNPYICKWEGEEGYKTLAESGVVCNQQGFSINHDKIAALNEILWAD